jgi:hypothetical protein
MNNKVIFSLVGVVIFCGLIAFITYESEPIENDRSFAHQAGDSPKQTAVSSIETSAVQAVDIDSLKTLNTVTATEPAVAKVPYEDDWCAGSLELNQQDSEFAAQETDNWDIQRGALIFDYKPSPSGLYEYELQPLIGPYIEMDDALLVELSYQDDHIAMLALMDRYKIDNPKRSSNIARKLLTLGKTGNALSYLVRKELVPISVALSEGDEITVEHKTRIARALAYANYGLKRYDASGMGALVIFMDDKFMADITDLMTEEVTENAEFLLTDLEELIDTRRAVLNLEPIAEMDTPKIAKHNFDFDLAVHAVSYPAAFESFTKMASTEVKPIFETQCLRQNIAFITGN